MEFCPKCVRRHGIEFLENRCLVLKCEGKIGVLLKYVKVLDGTMLNACLTRKDQQSSKCIDIVLQCRKYTNIQCTYMYIHRACIYHVYMCIYISGNVYTCIYISGFVHKHIYQGW